MLFSKCRWLSGNQSFRAVLAAPRLFRNELEAGRTGSRCRFRSGGCCLEPIHRFDYLEKYERDEQKVDHDAEQMTVGQTQSLFGMCGVGCSAKHDGRPPPIARR